MLSDPKTPAESHGGIDERSGAIGALLNGGTPTTYGLDFQII